MGISDEQIDAIIDAHTETVDALKAQRDELKADAEEYAETKKKLEAVKKIQEGVAFFNEEFSLKKELEKLTPFTHQLEDYSKPNKQIEENKESLYENE